MMWPQMVYKSKIVAYKLETKSGQETYFRVQIPKPLVMALGITGDDEVEWSLEPRGQEMVLVARVVKKKYRVN
jgi:hypothetical protein